MNINIIDFHIFNNGIKRKSIISILSSINFYTNNDISKMSDNINEEHIPNAIDSEIGEAFV